MGVVIDWKKNEILRGFVEEALEERREQYIIEGARISLRAALEPKLGKIPRWANLRIEHASLEQLTAWVAKVSVSTRIEDVVGRRAELTAQARR